MSIADDQVCRTSWDIVKSPVDIILWTISLTFTAQTSSTGTPILFTSEPAEEKSNIIIPTCKCTKHQRYSALGAMCPHWLYISLFRWKQLLYFYSNSTRKTKTFQFFNPPFFKLKDNWHVISRFLLLVTFEKKSLKGVFVVAPWKKAKTSKFCSPFRRNKLSTFLWMYM